MGYTNGSAYTLTANLTGPATVADAQYYTGDVYTKVLTAAAKLKITDVTVESGGTMTMPTVTAANSATFSKITVGNSGSVTIGNSNNALEFTVLSGGSLYTGNTVKLYNAVIRSGAKWSKTNLTQIGGSATNIERGAVIANNILGANFFVKDGVASDIDLIKHPSVKYNSVAHFYAIDIDNAAVNSGASMILSLGVKDRKSVV